MKLTHITYFDKYSLSNHYRRVFLDKKLKFVLKTMSDFHENQVN